MMKLFLLLLALIHIAPAEAALKWQYRSDSITGARYATGFKDMTRWGSATPLTLTAGPSGTFGGTYLDMSAAPIVVWSGLDNAPTTNAAITVLMRIIPKGSGAPAGRKSIFNIGFNAMDNNNAPHDAFLFDIDTSSNLQVQAASNAGVGYQSDGRPFSAPLTLVANQPTDIWYVWNGSPAAGSIKLYQAQNGATAALVGTADPGATMLAMNRAMVSSFSTYDPVYLTTNNLFDINEIAVFDSAENPVSYGTRTDFLTAASYEGYTANAALAATTKIGVAASDGTGTYDGSDRWTCPAAADILATAGAIKCNSTSTNRTGTWASAPIDKVRDGYQYGAGGTSLQGSLLCTDPGVTSVNNGVGYTIYSVSKTGTFLPSCTSVPPDPADVRSGEIYTIDSIGYVGELDVPPVNKVQLGYVYDDGATTGTLTCTALNPNVVADGTAFTNFTGVHTGTLEYVTNLLSSATLKQGTSVPSLSPLSITQGDSEIVVLWAEDGASSAFDLTGAVFTGYLRGNDEENVEFADAAFEADADQVGNKGKFLFTLSSTDTMKLAPGKTKELLVKVVQGSSIKFFRGKIIDVLPASPASFLEKHHETRYADSNVLNLGIHRINRDSQRVIARGLRFPYPLAGVCRRSVSKRAS